MIRIIFQAQFFPSSPHICFYLLSLTYFIFHHLFSKKILLNKLKMIRILIGTKKFHMKSFDCWFIIGYRCDWSVFADKFSLFHLLCWKCFDNINYNNYVNTCICYYRYTSCAFLLHFSGMLTLIPQIRLLFLISLPIIFN